MLARLLTAVRYARHGAPPWQWRIVTGRCPSCEGRRFIQLAATPFHTRCLRCTATLVNLSLIPVIRRHVADRFDGKRAYEMSSYGATYEFLRSRFRSFQCSEYDPERPLGSAVAGIRNEDATRLTFADESFDVVTSNQVFEHVADDVRAYRQCFRVLRSGGALIFSVPLYDAPRTQQVARLTDAGRIEWLGEPEYHDSRLAGPGSAPVFWRHSLHDVAARVAAAGFASAEVVQVQILERQPIPQPIVYAVKP